MAAGKKVYDGSGMWPNAIVLNRVNFRHAIQCAEIVDRIAASGAGDKVKPADITPQMLAACFDLQYCFVAGGAWNTANEGATASISSIWGNANAMVCRVATSNDISEPCIGRTFHWSADGSTPSGTFESYREEKIRGDVIRVRHQLDEVVLYAQAGHLLSNISA